MESSPHCHPSPCHWHTFPVVRSCSLLAAYSLPLPAYSSLLMAYSSPSKSYHPPLSLPSFSLFLASSFSNPLVILCVRHSPHNFIFARDILSPSAYSSLLPATSHQPPCCPCCRRHILLLIAGPGPLSSSLPLLLLAYSLLCSWPRPNIPHVASPGTLSSSLLSLLAPAHCPPVAGPSALSSLSLASFCPPCCHCWC